MNYVCENDIMKYDIINNIEILMILLLWKVINVILICKCVCVILYY